LTVTVWLLAADKLTVKFAFVVPEFPSGTLTSLIERPGSGSSPTIVSTAVLGVPKAALPVALLKVRMTTSLGSLSVSLMIGMLNVLDVSPVTNESVPDVAV